MSVLHIVGQIIWYLFLGCMILGGFLEFRVSRAVEASNPEHRAPCGSLAKRDLQYHRQIA